MPKPVVATSIIISLALVGTAWWWLEDKKQPESAVFTNESRDLTLSPEEKEESAPLPKEEESVQEEIQVLEEEKEETVPPVPTSESDPTNSDVSPKITARLIDFGYTTPKNPRSIDTIVLHSSYNSLGGDPYSVEKIIAIYKDYGVGAHYIIDRRGTIYRLVEDKNIAYHAGASKAPDGRTNVNDFSLGIELVNGEDDQYTKAQYAAVNNLVNYLEGAYSIKHVVGHSDIAPGRKTDPWNFDWKKLKQ